MEKKNSYSCPKFWDIECVELWCWTKERPATIAHWLTCHSKPKKKKKNTIYQFNNEISGNSEGPIETSKFRI